MNAGKSFSRLAVAYALSLCLVGCRILNPPAGITPRTLVLTPVQLGPTTAWSGSTNLVVGIRPVKMPGYLSSRSFVVRQNDNEIAYPETLEWAERLDNALQHVLGANLATLIPTAQMRFSIWDPETVSVQIDVNVVRFDVDSRGRAELLASWRITSPDGQKLLASGRFANTRKGPPPTENPQGAVISMSNLIADFAEALAQTIQQRTNDSMSNYEQDN